MIILYIFLFFVFLIIGIAKSKKWCCLCWDLKKIIKKEQKMKDFKELVKKIAFKMLKKEYIILKKLYK